MELTIILDLYKLEEEIDGWQTKGHLYHSLRKNFSIIVCTQYACQVTKYLNKFV